MTQRIPMFPEVEADLKAAEQANVWKPTMIRQIKAFNIGYCENCAARVDYDLEACDLIYDYAVGRIEWDEAIKVTSSGEPRCEHFLDVNS